MEHRNFYHTIILGMSGVTVSVNGRLLFMPHDGECLHEVQSQQILVTGEASVSMQHFLQTELARRLGRTGGEA